MEQISTIVVVAVVFYVYSCKVSFLILCFSFKFLPLISRVQLKIVHGFDANLKRDLE